MPRRADERNFQKPGRQHKTGVSGNTNIFCHKHQMARLQSIALRESIRYTAMLRTNPPSSPSSVPQESERSRQGLGHHVCIRDDITSSLSISLCDVYGHRQKIDVFVEATLANLQPDFLSSLVCLGPRAKLERNDS